MNDSTTFTTQAVKNSSMVRTGPPRITVEAGGLPLRLQTLQQP